ncbi:MAG: leucine-rich repeat domain-containing protein [Desulfobacteraceae bacterium]|nr:leucine-rich repeat domain-containing protein [Desulfobacteraceae bacterium]
MSVKKKTVFVISLIMIFMAGTACASEWVNISGTVYYNTQPLNVMVLANGQHMFTDPGDGRYQMDVPLNSIGRITLYAFCDGFAPFKAVLEPSEAENYDIDMSPATAGDNVMTVTANQISSAESGWVKISGEVRSESGTPLCAMVLANGQHVFSCEGDGAYNLEAPLNSSGEITLFVFCEGMQPYKKEWNGGNIVCFPDKNLETVIREAINKPTGYIQKSDLQGLTELEAVVKYIDNIEGLQYCTNLTWLRLVWNRISDISALAGLTDLTVLGLQINQISDISALADMADLTKLDLRGNGISDISALARLTDLTELDLSRNRIIDINALADMTNLTVLELFGNQISDISALADLTDLTELDLSDNQISDISAVTGLTDLTQLDLSGGNQISDISAVAGLTDLTVLDLSSNQISDISAVAGLTNLTQLDLDNNPLNATSCSVYIPRLQDRGVSVDHDCLMPDVFPDEDLETVIRQAIDKPTGDIQRVDLQNLTSLQADGEGIKNIEGLQYCTNLTTVNLSRNQISNISALAGMANLTSLELAENQISDINALAGLSSLTSLDLSQNRIGDISALAGPNVRRFNLTDNKEISELILPKGLISLKQLNLGNNYIVPDRKIQTA